MSKSGVAVVVPVFRDFLSEDEELAVRQLKKVLHGYPLYQISPRSLSFQLIGARVKKYANECFAGTDTYSRLLLSPGFYKDFLEYEYILIYQLDCLVFSDQLAAWCDKGYDYIGAPLAISKSEPVRGFSRVGNGGLSLRRVPAFIRVLESQTRPSSALSWFVTALQSQLPDLAHLPWFVRARKTMQVLRHVQAGVRAYASSYNCNEDLFWSDRAKLFDPAFRVAPLDAGLRFAFEMWPRHAFKLAGCRLPFGAHAWAKYDRGFWEPFLISEAAAIPVTP